MFNKFIKLNIKTEDDNLIRPAYYGGRCEVFGNPIKGDFIFHYDFSGMYTNRLKESFPYGDFTILDKIVSTVLAYSHMTTRHPNH
jgi:hypothetical protein